jgi:hypothetical protein
MVCGRRRGNPAAEYEQKLKEQLERSLRRKAAALGYELVAKPTPA